VDASCIDFNYPAGSGHALLLTQVARDQETGLVVGYVGFDSNYPRQMLQWDAHAFSQAAQFYAPNPLLITQPLGKIR
jgi:hypothetical protein